MLRKHNVFNKTTLRMVSSIRIKTKRPPPEGSERNELESLMGKGRPIGSDIVIEVLGKRSKRADSSRARSQGY
jgi:hypothetical protein